MDITPDANSMCAYGFEAMMYQPDDPRSFSVQYRESVGNPTAMALQNTSAKSVSDLKQMGLIYLATPYSKFPDGMEAAFIEAAMLTGRLLLEGVKVYSPIAHTHPIAVYANINPLDHKIWLPFDQAMMEVADTLVVAEMRSWSTSFGIAHEIEYFTEAKKPVVYLDPERLLMRATPGAVSLKGEAA